MDTIKTEIDLEELCMGYIKISLAAAGVNSFFCVYIFL